MPSLIGDAQPLLDLNCLVNPDHPLNVGMEYELAVIPNDGWFGANSWMHLTRNRFGSLINGQLINSALWSRQQSQPGGFGSLLLASASGQYISTGWTSTLGPNFSLAIWGRQSTATLSQSLIGKSAGPGGNVDCLLKTTTSGSIFMRALVGFSTSGNTAAIDTTVMDTNWHRWLVTLNGTLISLYRDGVLAATATGSGTLTTSSAVLDIGRQEAATGAYWGGNVNGLNLWPRIALSANEAMADYCEQLAGNPERWNWLSGRTYFFVGFSITSVAASDSPAAAISEASAILAGLSSTDSPTQSISDSSAILAALAANDDPTATLNELSTLLAALSLNDSVACSADELTALFCTVAISDSLQWSISDTSLCVVAIAISDTLSAAVADASSVNTAIRGDKLLGTAVIASMLGGEIIIWPQLEGDIEILPCRH